MDENINIPSHIGIIMDGNRRWAKDKKLLPQLGHKEGADNLKKIAEVCTDFGIKFLTVYAFSTENWKRSKEEVDYLMNLFVSSIKTFKKRSDEKDYRVQLTGDINGLSTELQKEILEVEEMTKNNKGLTINFAINYGGRAEILNVTKILASEYKEGNIKLEDINEDLFSKYLQTRNSPDPDLIIRTGGEERLSGFLMWQSAYSEFYFTDTLWPDMTHADIDMAVEAFYNRQRRYGKV